MSALAALVTLALFAPARAGDPKDPDISFDYRGRVRDQMRLVSEGKLKEAVDLLARHSLAGTFPEEGKEAMRKRLGAMYANGGKYLGQEVVGYKKVGSRVYRVYALAYFETDEELDALAEAARRRNQAQYLGLRWTPANGGWTKKELALLGTVTRGREETRPDRDGGACEAHPPQDFRDRQRK